MVDASNMRSRGKLHPRFIGPFRVTAVRSPLVVELELPLIMKTSNVFNVSRLKRFQRAGDDRFPGRIQIDRPPPIDVDGNTEYEVEYIIDKRCIKEGKDYVTRYLVKWVGYDVSEATWERESSMANSQQIVDDYESQQR